MKSNEKSVKELNWLEYFIFKLKSIPYFMRKISSAFLVLISFFFFIGAIFAGWIGVLNLQGDANLILSISVLNETQSHSIIKQFINLAEYFMVSVTFFAISIGLAYFSIIDTSENGIEKWANIAELEKYIFGMVIATISLIFLSGIINTVGDLSNGNLDNISPADMIMKLGFGMATVIISLGIYIFLSTRK